MGEAAITEMTRTFRDRKPESLTTLRTIRTTFCSRKEKTPNYFERFFNIKQEPFGLHFAPEKRKHEILFKDFSI